MGLCFGIHILGINPDFDTNFSTVMWDENTGPVEASWPISQNFTVYRYGTGVFEAAANTGYATRIVSFSTDLNFSSNSSKPGSRSQSIGFQLRTPGVGGEIGQFYDFATVGFQNLPFAESKGSDIPEFTKSISSEARTANIGSGSIYDFFQQTWTNR